MNDPHVRESLPDIEQLWELLIKEICNLSRFIEESEQKEDGYDD